MYPEDQGILAQPKKPGTITRAAISTSGIAQPPNDPDTDGRRQYSATAGDSFAYHPAAQGIAAPRQAGKMPLSTGERISESIGAVTQGSDAVGRPEVKQAIGEQGMRKNVTPPTSGIGTPPANFVAQPASSAPTLPTSGIAANPGTIVINGVPHQNLADQKFPGPIGMMANAAGETIKFAATAPFSSRAEERLAANRAELNPATAPAAAAAPTGPANVATPQAVSEKSANETPATPGIADGAVRVTKMPAGSKAPMGSGFDAADRQLGGRDISGQKLFTNVGVDGTAGMSLSQRAGNPNLGTADDNIRQLENIQKANAMMTPQGGAAFLADPNEAANAEKTARWGMQDMANSLKGKGRAGSAIAQVMAAGINGQYNLAAEQMRQQTAAAGQGVQARGQDISAQMEAAKIAGTPADQQLKQAHAQGIMAQTESSRALADIQKKALAGDAQAMATYQSLTGKNSPSYKAIHAAGGQTLDGKNPDQVFVIDERTGNARSLTGGSQQSAAQVPPAEKREIGKTYNTPKGPMVWRGNGWEAAR